jgi:hypothetical protein
MKVLGTIAMTNKTETTNQNLILKIANARGRYFGLYTKDGRVFNAQVVKLTPKFVTVYDRNRDVEFKVAKSNILKVNGLNG